MNLQPLTIKHIPIGVPLPWQIFDSAGYSLFGRGEIVAEEKTLEHLLANGLLRDVDGLPEEGPTDWVETRDLPPGEMFPPQGIKPQIWERLQLRLLGRDAQVYYAAHLIGYIKERSLLIALADKDGQVIELSEGETLEVRMLTGGNIVVFQAAIQRVCTSPVHYLHLEYPRKVRVQALRNSPWAGVDLMGSVANRQGKQESAHIANLSSDGALFLAPAVMGEAGATLRLTFHCTIDELETTLTLDTTIQHVRPVKAATDEGWTAFEHRVAFRHVPQEHALWLKCLAYQRIAEGYPA